MDLVYPLARRLKQLGYTVNVPIKKDETHELKDVFFKIQDYIHDHVLACPVTYPILHYFDENKDECSNTLFKKIQYDTIAIFLMSICYVRPKDIVQWCMEYLQGGTVKIQKEMIDYVKEGQNILKDEIGTTDIEKECNHLIHYILSSKKIPLAKSASPVLEKEKMDPLFHRCEPIRAFRASCQGRSWFSPNLYSFLFVIYKQPVNIQWKNIPVQLVNHRKEEIVSMLCSPEKISVPPSIWLQICKDLPSMDTPSIQHMNTCIFGKKVNPDGLQQFLTLSQPNWQAIWTKSPWPKRRSIVRKIQHYFNSIHVTEKDIEEIVSIYFQ